MSASSAEQPPQAQTQAVPLVPPPLQTRRRPTAARQQSQSQQSSQQQRRRAAIVFRIGRFIRFQCTRQRLLDLILDCMNFTIEYLVYLIGPLLILLALGIIGLLTHTFFIILIPMMKRKHETSPYLNWILAAHITFVCFLLVNILVNYYLCVMTKHKGPHYDKVVREFATACDFCYPETPVQLTQYRRDFQEKMVFRMRRRQARHEEQERQRQQQQQQEEEEEEKQRTQQQSIAIETHELSTDTSGMTHRTNAVSQQQQQQNNNSSNSNNNNAAKMKPKPKPKPPKPPVVRQWMLMMPFEWGFCSNSNQPKPPRSHYDHVTATLVLNLDHYCPWVFNAIGYFNYRYFVNFLIFIFIGMFYGTILMLEPFLLSKSREYKQQVALQRRFHKEFPNVDPATAVARLLPMMPIREEKMELTLSFMLCAAVGMAIVILGGFHMYLTMTAQTTIEFHANWAHWKRARQLGQKWKNPYSLGNWKNNWQLVYGKQQQYTQKWFFIGMLLSILPSRREPDYFPAPIPGNPLRPHAVAKEQKQQSSVTIPAGDDDDNDHHQNINNDEAETLISNNNNGKNNEDHVVAVKESTII